MLASYRELIAVGEFVVALENLCTNLSDLDVQLSPDTIREIGDAGSRLGMRKSLIDNSSRARKLAGNYST